MIRECVWDLGDLVRSFRKALRRHAVYHWGDWHRSCAKYAIPKVLRVNARLAGITARTTDRLLRHAGLPHVAAAPDGDPDELLTVKSNYNYGGRSERLLRRRRRELLGLTGIPRSIRAKWDYRVIPRRAVPAETWSDPSLAVQRFVSNAEGRLHRFRVCLDHRAVSTCVCPQPVKDFSIGARCTEEFLLRGSYDSALPRRAWSGVAEAAFA